MAGRFSVEAVFKAIDRITAPVSRMQNSVNKFTRSMQSGLGRLNRFVDGAFGSIFNFQNLKRGLIAATVFGASAFLTLKNFTDELSELHDVTQRLAFPIEQFQEWQFVAKQVGVDQESFTSALDQFNKRLGEAKAGGGPLISFLKRTDRELARQLLTAKDNASAFEIYIKRMQEVKDVNKQAALANAGFGRGAKGFVNITKLTSAEIEKLRKQQRENGLVTQANAEAADALGDEIDNLFSAFKGLRNSAMGPLVPVLTENTRLFRDWIVANREFISLKVENAIRFVRDNFTDLVAVGMSLAKIFVILIGVLTVLKIIVLAGNAAIILFNATMLLWKGGVLAVTLVTTAWTKALVIARAAMLALSIAMTANPIGLIIAAIAALIAVVVLIIVYWDEFVAAIKRGASIVWKVLKFLFPPFIFLEKMLGKIGELASSLFSGVKALLSPFSTLWNSIKNISANVSVDSASGASGEDVADAAPFVPQVVSPQDRMARTIEESIQRSQAEITIKDESGRSEITKQTGFGNGLSLAHSGGF